MYDRNSKNPEGKNEIFTLIPKYLNYFITYIYYLTIIYFTICMQVINDNNKLLYTI